ncbi:MAG: NAD(P)/FAD-dependent oxidoreductase, partial [Pseudomonadota bacterium]
YHTGEWPHEPIDFTDKRVCVIGTGSSAIQSIPIIAGQASSLTVFQRTANYTVPAWNEKLSEEYVASIKSDYPGLRAKSRARPTGFFFPFNVGSALDSPEEERLDTYQEFWDRGGLPFLGAYGDLLFDKDANDTVANFAREKIRAVVDDPETADLLCPDNVFGCKRLCVDTGYYETFNLPHVKLIDVAERPIERMTRNGVVAHGVEHECDVIVCATGFAAMTGSFDNMQITGRDGLTLGKKWEAGPRTYLGLSTAGFPNFFMVTGPGSPSVLANMIQSIEQHVDWIADCIMFVRESGAKTIDARVEFEDDWVDHVNEVAQTSLRSTCSSWYVGANIPGRPRVFMPYIGGFPIYVDRCNQVMTNSFEGFDLDVERESNEMPTVHMSERWRVPLDLDVITPAMLAARRVPVV